MAWSISDLFPPWGDTGTRPVDNKNYQGDEQVDEANFDYLWYSVGELEKETRAAFTDLDADKDGIVDEADTANLYKGNDIDTNGDGVVNDSDQYDGLAPADGTNGQSLKTDGTTTFWGSSAFTVGTLTSIADSGTNNTGGPIKVYGSAYDSGAFEMETTLSINGTLVDSSWSDSDHRASASGIVPDGGTWSFTYSTGGTVAGQFQYKQELS